MRRVNQFNVPIVSRVDFNDNKLTDRKYGNKQYVGEVSQVLFRKLRNIK